LEDKRLRDQELKEESELKRINEQKAKGLAETV
jgi:hypothetical protein